MVRNVYDIILSMLFKRVESHLFIHLAPVLTTWRILMLHWNICDIPIFIIFSYLDISSIQNKFDDFDKIVKDNNDFRCDLANTTFWRLSLKWGLWFPGNIFLGVFFIIIGKKLFSKVGWTLILYILLQIFD